MLGLGKVRGIAVTLMGLILINCETKRNEALNEESTLIKASSSVYSVKEFRAIATSIQDTVNQWCLNKLSRVVGETAWGFKIDTIKCFNTTGDRLVTAIHVACKDTNCVQDEIKYLFGEKIDGRWYFFRGASVTIPRTMVKEHDIHTPLSYQQLHQIAINEIFGGYLNPDGSINETFFTSLFEGPGWGDFNDQTLNLKYMGLKKDCVFVNRRKFFEAVHLQSVKNNWYGVKKDTTLNLE